VREGQRGFTVIEVLLALAIALPVALALASVVRLAVAGAQSAASYASEAAVMDDLVDRLDAESHGAAALFEPQTDVLGNASCDAHRECRELDFFTRDAQNVPHFWAYRFDPKANALQRYEYDDLQPGGLVNLRTSGDPIALRSFEVKNVPISRVHVASIPDYPIADVSVALGYPGVTGGNALAVVNMSNGAYHLRRELLPRLAASGFTVVVGSYTPAPAGVPSPSPTPRQSGQGTQRSYLSHVFWTIGPCVNEPPQTPGCGPGGSGQQQTQTGDSYGPGGPLVAPAASQIPLQDVCQSPSGPDNPNAAIPLGQYDATQTLYGSVTDPVNNVTEAWYVPNTPQQQGYIVPVPPLTGAQPGQADPFRMILDNGPGYSYQTIFEVSC
jgi:type II secretory pathway pseudopilin PulG